jgi:cell division ATPase FtsA
MIPANIYKDLIKIFDELEIDIIDFIPNILWAETGALDSETKDLWCVLIDLWANQTSYVIYEEWVNLWYGIIPIWWEEITKDISIWLKIDYSQAEQIKKEEWEIILDKNNQIEDSEIDKLFLSEIIEARLSEDIYSKILDVMNELWVSGKLAWWVILIWWTSKIRNIEEFTREYFSLACRKWKISWYNELWSNPIFINSIWNYIWEEKYWEEWGWFSLSFNMWWLKSLSEWFKKIF